MMCVHISPSCIVAVAACMRTSSVVKVDPRGVIVVQVTVAVPNGPSRTIVIVTVSNPVSGSSTDRVRESDENLTRPLAAATGMEVVTEEAPPTIRGDREG